MREIEVRQVGADDWADIRAIRLAALTADPSAFGATLDSELGYDEERWRSWPESCGVFLGRLDGEPVAIAGGQPDRDEVKLISVWARPSVRGTGAGAAVVRAVIDWAADRRMTAWAVEGNERALGLYRKLGFMPTGRDRAHPKDSAVREVELDRR
ncbi:GNAT family N-acetyltransferase [Actinokineospora xionganensis]|uniref:GNAT family N-acetyltransferase n=1 Tax=Actinokineospora xionganensis TaxID=2684470 RepID=A0ABR7LH55_9PSEU|nr:GNAT family N-acetyltransferase [Actinokineospora xionganensis]MBC6451716.1 GNAT family N-acetyltransferase [Actinokineospora xionganensis]